MNRAHARFALIGGILMLALAGVNYFSFYPLLVEPDEPQVYGEPLLRADGAAVALLVDTAAIRRAGTTGSFSATDWSYGWLNLLLQEEKRFDVLDVASETDLSRYEVAIFTRSAAPAAPDLLRQSHPTRAVIETPPAAALNSLTGGAVSLRDTALMVHLDEFDFAVVTSPLAGADLRPALTLSGETLATEYTRNDQTLIFTAFDFGALAVEIQQGRPNDDFSVTPRITKKTGQYPLVTSDLVADSSYFERFTPFFDLFEHRLWAALSGGRPAKPLWDNSRRGAFVMSHDEEGVGRFAGWMAQQESRWGVRSATLVTPAAVDSAALAAIYQSGGEVGLHVDKYSYFERPGLPGLRPLRTVIPVAEQINRLENRGARELMVNRNHWLQWSDHYTEPLRILAAAGVKLDLSYGPLTGALVGYVFGTAFPFVPLDTNGFPLPILELPFLFQDDERFAAEYLDSFFDTTQFNEEIINVIFHANTMAVKPDTLIMWGWRECFSRADRSGLPILHYGDILTQLKAADATAPPQVLHIQSKTVQ